MRLCYSYMSCCTWRGVNLFYTDSLFVDFLYLLWCQLVWFTEVFTKKYTSVFWYYPPNFFIVASRVHCLLSVVLNATAISSTLDGLTVLGKIETKWTAKNFFQETDFITCEFCLKCNKHTHKLSLHFSNFIQVFFCFTFPFYIGV